MASCDGSDGVNLNQNGVIENAKTYKISFEVLNYVGGFLNGRIGSANSNDFTVNSNGSYSFNVLSDGTNLIFRSSSFNGSISNISVQEIQVNTPRIDFSDSADGALLLEPQRTNAMRYSSDFSQWSLKWNVTINSNVGLAPDGTLSADRIVFNGATNARVEDTAQGIDAFSYTNDRPISVWLKSESGTTTVQFGSSSSYLLTVTVTEEWQRFTHISKQGFARIRSDNATSVLAWGYQFETNGDVSLSYPTSYIPTQGSASTRIAETCNNSGSAQDFNSEEGVLYAEISALANDGTFRGISISDGTNNNRIALLFSNNSNIIRVQVLSNNSLDVLIDKPITTTQSNKFAFSYNQNNFKFWINGIKVGTDTSGNTPIDLNSLQFNSGSGGSLFYGNVKSVQVFTTALSDEELQKLTTI